MSGSPMAKLITSSPFAFFKAILRFISNKYGGKLERRLITIDYKPKLKVMLDN